MGTFRVIFIMFSYRNIDWKWVKLIIRLRLGFSHRKYRNDFQKTSNLIFSCIGNTETTSYYLSLYRFLNKRMSKSWRKYFLIEMILGFLRCFFFGILCLTILTTKTFEILSFDTQLTFSNDRNTGNSRT